MLPGMTKPGVPDPDLLAAIQASLDRSVRACDRLAELFAAVPPGVPFPAIEKGDEIDRAIIEQRDAMYAVQRLTALAAATGPGDHPEPVWQ